jgi:sterol 3beta-glucosyltransferase
MIAAAAAYAAKDAEAENPELGEIEHPQPSSSEDGLTSDSAFTTPSGTSTPVTDDSFAEYADPVIIDGGKMYPVAFHDKPVPNDEKLRAIVEEFGDYANLFEGENGTEPEPERMLAECKGSLFK